MQNIETTWELRRKSHVWFHTRAANAKMCAKLLYEQHQREGGFSYWEGFVRESAIAIELILKAVICLRTNSSPQNTHDVYSLWEQAKLGPLTDDDWQRLAEISQTLYWAGRYAAPTKDVFIEKDENHFRKHERKIKFGKTHVIEPTPNEWPEFEALYETANLEYYNLHRVKP